MQNRSASVHASHKISPKPYKCKRKEFHGLSVRQPTPEPQTTYERLNGASLKPNKPTGINMAAPTVSQASYSVSATACRHANSNDIIRSMFRMASRATSCSTRHGSWLTNIHGPMHGGTGRSKAVKQLPATEGHPAVWGIHVATKEEQARGSLPPLARQKCLGGFWQRSSPQA